jgi:hypothetical protein
MFPFLELKTNKYSLLRYLNNPDNRIIFKFSYRNKKNRHEIRSGFLIACLISSSKTVSWQAGLNNQPPTVQLFILL